MYTVYIHTTPNNKKYVGITVRKPEHRWKNGAGYIENSHFWNAIKKYGWNNIKHEIISENLTKEEAENKEMELIALYKSNQHEYGYNRDNGGRCAGTHTDEWRRRMSENSKGNGNPFFGKHHTEETLKKITGENNHRFGTKWTPEKHEIMRNAYKGIPKSAETRGKMKTAQQKRAVKVMRINPNTKAIEIFDSFNDAVAKTGTSKGNICACCKGDRKTAGGYMWSYCNEYIPGLKEIGGE